MAPLNFIFVAVMFLSGQTRHDTILVRNDTYTILYSQNLEQPLRIEYTVECSKHTASSFSRVGMNFYTERGIHTSDDKDYKNNIWDKGHMAPAADFSCDLNKLKKTFSYVNCTLQHKDLNRGAWKDLEEYERELAINNNVSIQIEVEFNNPKRVPSGAAIPSSFTKRIYINNKLFKTYKFPNTTPTQSFEKYLVK